MNILEVKLSAHVLLNLLNELGKRDKMRGLPLSLWKLYSSQAGDIRSEPIKALL